MRNVLLNGASSLLGRSLLERLRDVEGVKRVIGVESRITDHWMEGVELLALEPDHRAVVDLLQKQDVDTVLHCGLAPDRTGSSSQPAPANVIDTMRLGAAVGHPDVPVRSFVLASSTAAYPIASHAPLLNRESHTAHLEEGSVEASFVEAEDYARDLAERAPHLNVAIVRLQSLIGRKVRGPLASVLRQPILPFIPGYDPAVQLLHLEDAVEALTFAADVELAGIYNVASAGLLRWSQIADVLQRPRLPVLPVPLGPFEGLARATGAPHLPAGVADLLRLGHAVDTTKLEAAGFNPRHDQETALISLVRPERSSKAARS